jgi:hypothetical protein
MNKEAENLNNAQNPKLGISDVIQRDIYQELRVVGYGRN